MLRTCILDFGGNWGQHMTLIEFAYKNIETFLVRFNIETLVEEPAISCTRVPKVESVRTRKIYLFNLLFLAYLIIYLAFYSEHYFLSS